VDLDSFPATQCVRTTYDGEKWAEIVEIPSEEYKLECTSPTTTVTSLLGSTCSLYYNKGEVFGIAEGTEFVHVDIDREIDPDIKDIEELKPDDEFLARYFSSGQVAKMTFGDDKCAFANLYSAFAGLTAIAALAFF